MRTVFVPLAVAACAASASAQTVIMSLSNGASIYQTGHQDTELSLVDVGTMSSSIFFSNEDWDAGGANDIDAFSLRNNGNLVLSVSSNATLGGVSFSDDHLIEYNPSTGVTTSFFDFAGLLSGPSDPDIDAVHVFDDGSFVFSVLNDQTLNYAGSTVPVANEDLVFVDPTAMTASVFFDGSAHFTDDEEVTSASIDELGRLVLSAGFNDAELGGLVFGRGDLVAYDLTLGIAELLIDSSTDIYSGATEDIDANHYVIPAPGSVGLLGVGLFVSRRRRR